MEVTMCLVVVFLKELCSILALQEMVLLPSDGGGSNHTVKRRMKSETEPPLLLGAGKRPVTSCLRVASKELDGTSGLPIDPPPPLGN